MGKPQRKEQLIAVETSQMAEVPTDSTLSAAVVWAAPRVCGSTNISIDADVKVKAQELFSDLGIDLSTAINIFLRQSIRENGIPFTV